MSSFVSDQFNDGWDYFVYFNVIPLCAFLILFLQAAMTLLQAGYARDRLFKSVMVKNVVGLFVTILVWWWWGFGFAVGDHEANLAPHVQDWAAGFDDGRPLSNSYSIGFFLTVVYAIYTVSIICSAAADRLSTWSYWVLAFVTAGATFPLLVNWIWAGFFKARTFHGSGWMVQGGSVDYAGGGVVNLLGGVCGGVAVWFVGPRPGRFEGEGTAKKVMSLLPYNPTSATVGTLLFAFCYMGYLFGAAFIPWSIHRTTTVVNVEDDDYAKVDIQGVYSHTAIQIAGHAVCMALISVGGALFTSTFLFFNMKGYKYNFSIPLLNESIIGGLVAISAGAGVVNSIGAFFIGCGAGIIALYGPNKPVFKGLDDVRHIITVHAYQGAWSLFAVGLWADPEWLAAYTTKTSLVGGVFYGANGVLLGRQVLEIVIVTAVGFTITAFTLMFCNIVNRRISESPVPAKDEVCAEVPLLVAEHVANY